MTWLTRFFLSSPKPRNSRRAGQFRTSLRLEELCTRATPSDISDPDDPMDPTDPTDPTLIADPSDTGDPSDPSDPTDPTLIADPGTPPPPPTDPGDPGDPSDPSGPTLLAPGTPPDITEFGGMEVGAGWYQITGHVAAVNPAGLTVNFEADTAANGKSAVTNDDGDFTLVFTVKNDGSDVGAVAATTSDANGASNTAILFMDP
jgi:hypothetical protein